MSYNVEFKMTYNDNLPGKTFKTWIETLTYADLNGLFPEFSAEVWPTVKTSLLNILSEARPTVGVTPGVADFTEVTTDNDVTINITFNDIDGYHLYAEFCDTTAENQFKLRPGFAFELTEGIPINPYPVQLDGRAIVKTIDNSIIMVSAPLGPWLFAKYHITYLTTRSCTHTTT